MGTRFAAEFVIDKKTTIMPYFGGVRKVCKTSSDTGRKAAKVGFSWIKLLFMKK